MEKFTIIRIINNKKETLQDFVTEEISLTIAINNKEITTLLCTPENINDLITGYLFTSGIIQNIDEIINIILYIKKWIA